MLNILVYAVAFAAAVSVAAASLEHLTIRRRLPRRFVWLAAMLCSVFVPPAIMLNSSVAPATTAAAVEHSSIASDAAVPAPTTTRPGRDTPTEVISSASPAAQEPATESWQVRAPSNRTLLLVWAAMSGTLLCLLIAAGISLRWRANRWQRTSLRGMAVMVSEDTGPALLGVMQPQIVVPRWFMDEPIGTQTLILAHEQQHIAAHDPLLLRTAMLLAVVAPWNLPLWWQLRRLRLAIELDCDARVMRGGAEPGHYGEVLLEVTQRAAAMPVGVIAMSEPVSALERRIRSLAPAPERHAVLRMICAALVATAGVGAAAALEAPAMQGGSRAAPGSAAPALAATPARPAQPAAPAQPMPALQPVQPARISSGSVATQGANPAVVQQPRVPATASPARTNSIDVRDLAILAAARFGKRFVLDPRVRSTVELIGFTPESMTYHAFLEILGVYGFVAVPSGDVVTIIPEMNARAVASPIVSADNITGDDSEIVTVLIPVSDKPSETAIQISMTMRQYISQAGELSVTADQKSLLLVEKVANAKRIVALVRAQSKAP